MKYYFKLQLKIFHRQLQAQGIPIIFFGLVASLCLVIIYHSLIKFSYASYVLLYLAIYGFEAFQRKAKIELLKTLFPEHFDLIKIKAIENLVILAPTLLVTIAAKIYWTIPILLISYLFYSLQTYSLNIKSNKALPTPFGKHPFEMIQFFRTFYLVLIIALFLFIMGILYDNINLALFGITLIPFFTLNIIEKVEPEQIVWNNAKTAKTFLFRKIKRITLQVFALMSPLALTLLVLKYNHNIALLIIGVYLLSAGIIALITLMKYSVYPRRIGIMQGIILATSGIIPFLFLALYPYFYRKAVENLKKFLC